MNLPDDDPLAVPPALRLSREARRAAWAGRVAAPAQPFAPDPPAKSGEDPATAALRAELEQTKSARAAARITRMKARIAAKKEDRSQQRWDPRKNRFVYDGPPLPLKREELKGMNVDLEEKDFIVMSGPDLVRWYNAACEVARSHHMASYKPVTKFESKETGAKRCAFLASSLRAALRASTEGDQVSAPREEVKTGVYNPEKEDDKDLRPPFLREPPAGAVELKPLETKENDVAKKRAKKTNGNGEASGYRIKGKPAKTVGEFKTVRAGTDRATVLKMAATKSTADLETIAKELGCEPKYVAVHLYSLNRDSGIGYEVDKKGNIELKFPGSKTVKDAIVEKAAE